MNDQLNKMLSICIFGKNCVSELKDCIRHANELTDKILFVDLGSDDQSKSKAAELGARVVDLHSFTSTLQSEWVLFLKPSEAAVLTSKRNLYSILSNKRAQGYLVYTKNINTEDLLKEYQFIQNLRQYKKIGNQAYITKLECRLVRKDLASDCLETLIDDTKKERFNFKHIIDGLMIETIPEKASKAQEEIEDHDRRCLKGEILYGPVPNEGIDELSSGYIGFRVLHERYLDGFLESARRGFGIDNMYLPMIEYLNKNENFQGSKDLFESWMRNRDGNETTSIHKIGGRIYAHLFMLDEAIACFEKAAEISPEPSVFADAGKLYLVKGEREKAIKLLEKSINMQPDPFHMHILSIIGSNQWKPLAMSLCMIAKDEEDTIAKALETMKDIADEIIVVDTGSSDRTGEIAGDYGGKVIEAPWDDDFSAVRNIALREARGDYVFVLDGDEFIDISDQLGLALFKKVLPAGCDIAYKVRIKRDEKLEDLSVLLLNKLLKQEPIDHQVRLFPRRSEIFFTGNAFESVDCSLRQANIKTVDAQLFKIVHRRENANMRDKRKILAVSKSLSPLEIPEKAIEGGLFFLKLGDLEQAYAWFEKSEKADPHLVAKIAMFYTSQNRYDYAEAILKKALNDFPNSFDLNMALAEAYLKNERYEDVCAVLSSIINSENKELNHDYVTDAFYYYGIALLEMENIAQGIEQITCALEKDPLDMRYQVGGLYAFAKSDQWDRFFEAADEIIRREKMKIGFGINNFSDVGYLLLEMFRHFANAGKQDEQRMCKRILKYLIQTKIGKNEEIAKMMEII